MPASGAIAAFGTLLQLGNVAVNPTSYTTVAEIQDVMPPVTKTEFKEVTTQVSPGAYKEWIATTVDPGSASFKINYIPTDPTHDSATGLYHIENTRKPWAMKIIYSDAAASAVLFNAFVEGIKPDAKVGDQLSADVTLKISGAPTFP